MRWHPSSSIFNIKKPPSVGRQMSQALTFDKGEKLQSMKVATNRSDLCG